MGRHHKLHNFERKRDFFDCDRFIIKLQHDIGLDEFRNLTAEPSSNNSVDPFALSQSSTFLHEVQHYVNLVGTPLGIYDALLRFTCLTQISFYLRTFSGKGKKLKLPFEENMDEYPIIASTYALSTALTSYLYGDFNRSGLQGIDYITKTKLREIECDELYKATQGKVKRGSPTLVISFNKDGKKSLKYMPIGLLSILEGFARLNQDMHIKKYQRPELYEKDYLKRMGDKEYTLYYILKYYANSLLDGLELREQEIMILISFYLSLLCLRPINQWPYIVYSYFGLYEEFLNEQVEQFLSNLSHPGQTFIDALFALKEIAREKGGIPLDKEGIIHLINETGERIGCRSVKFLYERFSLFLRTVIKNGFPIGPSAHSYTNHYFEISLSLMEAAAYNPYDFILHPWELLSNLNLPMKPMVIGKEYYITDREGHKTDWFLFSYIIKQFFEKKRIFCYNKIIFGRNAQCAHDKECSLDKIDYPYSNCDKDFIEMINWVVGDVNKLSPRIKSSQSTCR